MADLTVPLDELVSPGDPGHATMHATERDYINDLAAALVDRPTTAALTTALGAAPTLDDLTTGTYLGAVGTGRFYLLVAPFNLRVASASIIGATAVTSSTTVYYTIALRRVRGGTATSFANKTTNAADGAGGQAIAVHQPWTFDNVAFSGTVSQLAQGDAVALEVVATGAVPTLAGVSATIRYVPL